ncbi:MAG: hypothetical protein ACFCUS_10155 [Rubrimonas sp.]|uniref:hypothetical protein n=1 Tax=Rubrimonas sp. TaxID=2036015 RepID=UPI002FDDC3AD
MRPPFAFLALLVASPAAALDYDACMALVARAPEQAEVAALRWAREGGGDGAQHCRAMALAAQGALDPAAALLADLAAAPGPAPAETRAAMLAQAAGFWRADGQPMAARAALDRALDLDRGNVEALAARADLSASEGHLAAAWADLAAARSAAPGDAALLVVSAALRRALGDPEGARADADAALRARPGAASALFERGAAKAALGDRPGARADWLDAIAADPDGPDAERARLALQDMDGG